MTDDDSHEKWYRKPTQRSNLLFALWVLTIPHRPPKLICGVKFVLQPTRCEETHHHVAMEWMERIRWVFVIWCYVGNDQMHIIILMDKLLHEHTSTYSSNQCYIRRWFQYHVQNPESNTNTSTLVHIQLHIHLNNHEAIPTTLNLCTYHIPTPSNHASALLGSMNLCTYTLHTHAHTHTRSPSNVTNCYIYTYI